MKISRITLGAAILASMLATPLAGAAPAPAFVSKSEKYSIVLPAKAQQSSRTMALPGRGQMKVNFVSATKAPLTFFVIPMKLPGASTGASIDQFLNGVERGFTMSTGAKLLSRKKISLNGANGREIVVQAGTNLLRGRFFVKGNRSYQVVAVAPSSSGAKYNPQIMQVLNSFRILK